MTQVRPDNPKTQGASDNDFSDVELKGKDCSLQDLLRTEVGGSKDEMADKQDTEPSVGVSVMHDTCWLAISAPGITFNS